MSINAVTLVSGRLLSLAEQKAVIRDKISINNMVVTVTNDRIIKVF